MSVSSSDDEYEDVDDYEEELDEHLSVISEPAEVLGAESVEQRARARSEGGSPTRHSPTEVRRLIHVEPLCKDQGRDLKWRRLTSIRNPIVEMDGC